jgi:hypothetical protein
VVAAIAVVTILLGFLPPCAGPPEAIAASTAPSPPPLQAPPSSTTRERAPRVEVTNSNSQEIVLDVTVPFPEEEQVRQSGTTYHRLSLPHTGSTAEIGQPEVPTFGSFLAIPKGAELHVELLADTVETRSGYLLYPAQEPRLDQDQEPEFAIDLASYQRDQHYPAQIVELEEPMVIRGVDVALIRFYPVQYNPARREVTIHTSFRVRVSFVSGTGVFGEERLRSPHFDPLLASTLLNYSELGPLDIEGSQAASSSAKGCDYLIITAPHLVSQANLLADWKTRRGIDTEVRTTAQTGSTAAAIRSYIQNAYDTWSPPPSFVLLLGDAEFVPTNYFTIHPQQPPEGMTLIGTDLYYATTDGADYFADISIGRISVDSAAQAQNTVGKIIDYERNPTGNAAFYNNLGVAAYFEDENPRDGQEDRAWVQTSQEIVDYVEANGYVAYQIYYAEPEVNPLYFFNGDPLPLYLLRVNGFPWIGGSTDIRDAVNTGRFILNHRDHGVRWMWVQPEFAVWDVQGLTNGKKLPVVFSMNCETGWFDNETDDPVHGTYSFEVNFAETWQRNFNGGAAGVIAASRASYSGYNDHLNKGFYDAIWPDFLPYTLSSSPFSQPQYRMGHVLNYGKLYMASLYDEGSPRRITFEVFHYFGDPTMEIWTAYPQELSVSHDTELEFAATSFTAQVSQAGATISLFKDGVILGTALSSGGSTVVTLSAVAAPGTAHVTVTKHNYRPYEGTVIVADSPYHHYLPAVVAG